MSTTAPTAATTPPEREALVERLAQHRTLRGIPRHELEWLAAHGEVRHFAAGAIISTKLEPISGLYILFTGHVAIYVDRGTGRRKVLEWRGGDVTGMLPYSRMVNPPGDSVTDEDAEVLLVDRSLFPELTRECPEFTARTVHVMLDRARAFQSSDLQDEKMVSLGKLSAGLAHELNNPSSAAARGARLLVSALSESDAASRALGAAGLTGEQFAVLERVRGLCLDSSGAVHLPIERADREERISDWLEAHAADPAAAAPLADTPITLEQLDELAGVLPRTAVAAALRWLAANCTMRTLATDIERATSRAADLVAVMKRYTNMDRAAVAEPTDIRPGIADSAKLLAHKARQKTIALRLELPADLPMVEGMPGELNQVWSNLIDNALDAAPEGGAGEVTLRADEDHREVRVRVIDNGPGIPAELHSRIFDPFFTTKPVGQGTGLGLDVARRVVRRHNGEITVTSQPGRTEFCVVLPAVRQ
ncbi:MAG TPA: ATP-binding protein [Gemmatimonadaceae bacterium]|nr:ATP-binding protein [Gemmatimonadaceae bacterium]